MVNFPKLSWPRREPRQPDPPGVIPASLVRSAKAASWIAYFCLVYFLWLYTLDIARDRAAPMHLTHVGTWVSASGGLFFWFPYIVGFAVIAIGIPYVAKIALPTFMSLNWLTDKWAKGWSLFIVLAVSLVVFAGTFTIQGETILEKGRDAAVAVEKVQMGRAVLDGQIAAKEAELKSMMENRNAYLAQAASVGAKEWQASYIDKTAKGDVQYDRITRALGAAKAADAVRADLTALRTQRATSGAVAAVQERVVTRASQGWIADSIDWIQGVRAILLSLVMDIVALLMPWIALRLEQARARQMADAPADALPIMIEDHSAEAMPAVQPMQPMEKREQYFDEDGNKIVRRKATWARVPTKKSGRKERDPETGKQVDDLTEYEAPAKSVSLNVEEPETVAEPEPEMETVAVAEPEAPAPVEPEPPEEEPAAEPEAPLILSDETVEALEGAGIVKDGELPDQFVTPEGNLNTEAVREHMANERGLPAPREDAEAA